MGSHVARYSDKRWTAEATRWKGPSRKRRRERHIKRWSGDIVATVGKEWINNSR